MSHELFSHFKYEDTIIIIIFTPLYQIQNLQVREQCLETWDKKENIYIKKSLTYDKYIGVEMEYTLNRHSQTKTLIILVQILWEDFEHQTNIKLHSWLIKVVCTYID